jgi:uncharacterized protein YecE (DUF72 family)
MLKIGTSGWSYNHWQGLFYPKELSKEKWLEYYCQHFDTIELNNTFYHLPKLTTFEKWHQRTPKDFLFSVKASRFLTHILKLNNAREPLKNLLDNASGLQEKLGPILFQFPPNFGLDRERLKKFVKILPTDQRLAFEFRHPSWFCDEVYDLLKKNNLALTFSDTPNYPLVEKVTADFIYIRLHGHAKLYASKYSTAELKNWAERIKNWRKQNLNVFVYFDNDASAYAIQNAQDLKKLLPHSKINQMETKFYPREKLERDILQIVGRYLNLNQYRLFFFGSRVEGKGDERSDIDIGIEGPENIPLEAIARIRDDLANLPTLYSFDVVDFTQADADFKEVAQKHIEEIKTKNE